VGLGENPHGPGAAYPRFLLDPDYHRRSEIRAQRSARGWLAERGHELVNGDSFADVMLRYSVLFSLILVSLILTLHYA
jgi:hypothetical protein